MKRGHQQTEANYKKSEKEEEVGRVLSGFPLTLRPRKIPFFLYQSSFDFDSSFSLYFKSRFGKIMTWAFIAQKPSRRFIAPITLQSVRILQVISHRLECLIQSW